MHTKRQRRVARYMKPVTLINPNAMNNSNTYVCELSDISALTRSQSTATTTSSIASSTSLYDSASRPPSPLRSPLPPPPSSPVRAKRMTDAAVSSVLSACRRVDPDAALASATYTEAGETLVRIRSSSSCSVCELQKQLKQVLLLSHTSVTENALDGALEAEIIVPTGNQERRAARVQARARWLPKLLLNVGIVMLCAGIGTWASELHDAVRIVNATNVPEEPQFDAFESSKSTDRRYKDEM